MGIDQVDPAMLQMMVGQMQSMFASTDTDTFNVTLATDTARKTVSEAGRRRSSARPPAASSTRRSRSPSSGSTR